MTRPATPTGWRGALCAAAVAALCWLAAPTAAAQAYDYYRVNGETMPIDMQQMMALYGLPPGDYYVDEVGNFGMVGQPPMMNVNGGPPVPGGSGKAPAATAPGAPAPGNAPNTPYPGGSGAGGQIPGGADGGLTGTRMFWIYSSALGYGGSSGYVHLCPGGVYHRSSEASFSVGGDYNPHGTTPGGMRDGMNSDSASGAGVSRGTGRWHVDGGLLVLQDHDGSVQRFNAADVRRGTRWQVGQFRYAAEAGRASCP